jgi:hypothetical protein
MDYFDFTLKVASLLFIVVVFTRLLMVVAKYIGEIFGVGGFFISLLRKITNWK